MNTKIADGYKDAIFAYKSNKFDDALLLLDQYLESDANNFQLLHAKGLILKKLERLEEASKYYGLSIEFCNNTSKKEKLILIKTELDSKISSSLFNDLIDLDYNDEYPEIKSKSNDEEKNKTQNEDKVQFIGMKIQELLDNEKYYDSIVQINKILDIFSNSDILTLQEEDIDQFYVAKAYALYNIYQTEDLNSLLTKSLEINPNNEDAKSLMEKLLKNPIFKEESPIQLQIKDNKSDLSLYDNEGDLSLDDGLEESGYQTDLSLDDFDDDLSLEDSEL
jgi:tetratricopeptide (TPR) repeat protein